MGADTKLLREITLNVKLGVHQLALTFGRWCDLNKTIEEWESRGLSIETTSGIQYCDHHNCKINHYPKKIDNTPSGSKSQEQPSEIWTHAWVPIHWHRYVNEDGKVVAPLLQQPPTEQAMAPDFKRRSLLAFSRLHLVASLFLAFPTLDVAVANDLCFKHLDPIEMEEVLCVKFYMETRAMRPPDIDRRNLVYAITDCIWLAMTKYRYAKDYDSPYYGRSYPARVQTRYTDVGDDTDVWEDKFYEGLSPSHPDASHLDVCLALRSRVPAVISPHAGRPYYAASGTFCYLRDAAWIFRSKDWLEWLFEIYRDPLVLELSNGQRKVSWAKFKEHYTTNDAPHPYPLARDFVIPDVNYPIQDLQRNWIEQERAKIRRDFDGGIHTRAGLFP